MQKTSQKEVEWRRYKEVSIPWAKYDAHRLNECKHVLDLKDVFVELDRPVQRREFKLSRMVVLLLFKIMFGISYRGIASATKDLEIYKALKLKRAPCYKTIQNTIGYLDENFLLKINQMLVPHETMLAGVDSSGMKTNCKGAWVQVRFQRYCKKKEFKKLHIFVDLISKKIIYCLVTKGTSHDAQHLKKILKKSSWIKVEIVLGDGGYDSKECFNGITSYGSIPGIKTRKNSVTKSRGCPSRRKAVLAQKRDIDKWKKKVKSTMRCIVEAIFSGTKRRFGESFFSKTERFRKIEAWLRTILWNVLIYPR
jgi:hypothetical protein